jgi:hypothetical protein
VIATRVAQVHDRFVVAGMLGILSVSFAAGCGKPKPPPMVEVSGRITINEAPLPSARIRFMPTFPGFGAEVIAEAVSGPDGRYALTCSGSQGACIGTHRVVVEEGPLPAGLSGESGESQMKMTRYLQSLSNRPIPPHYNNVAQTPLTIEVKDGETSYDLKLTR